MITPNIYEFIKEIISKNHINNQDEILHILLKKYNVQITQSLLSRKLTKLKIKKHLGRYILPQPQEKIRIIPAPPNLLLIKTKPGYANAIATQIDNYIAKEESDDILACVAGDDTIITIVKQNCNYNKVIKLLETIINE